MQKSLIRQRFSRCLKTYEENAVVQKKMAIELAELLERTDYKNVLELGCGTGFLTSQIYGRLKFADYTAVDIVEECSEYISKISDGIEFICSDVEDFSTDKKFDLIVSNASLQWVENLSDYIKKIRLNLNDGGCFLFTLFGKDNFKEMSDFVSRPLKYYSVEELKNIFSEFKIEKIYDKKEVMKFSTPIDVLRHIKLTGVNALSNNHWTKRDLINFEKAYPVNDFGKSTLTYHPVYIKLSV